MKERLKQRIDLELNRGQLPYVYGSCDRIEYLNKLNTVKNESWLRACEYARAKLGLPFGCMKRSHSTTHDINQES